MKLGVPSKPTTTKNSKDRIMTFKSTRGRLKDRLWLLWGFTPQAEPLYQTALTRLGAVVVLPDSTTRKPEFVLQASGASVSFNAAHVGASERFRKNTQVVDEVDLEEFIKADMPEGSSLHDILEHSHRSNLSWAERFPSH
jgi:hypothetical protein